MKTKFFLVILIISSFKMAFSQAPSKPNSTDLYHQLKQLNFIGSALYIAAHPDDENTRLISYLANEKMARTAYLSLTRGDGGQNLIGSELRELLGVIRTQELLGARSIDGGIQFFSRANDFGYSKNPKETLSFWNKDAVLSDVVRIIRQFKPDVIINRFNHRNPGTTHGHHTSSAILSYEAFDLVGNAEIYPESAKQFGTWQPKRLFFNTSWWFYGSRENFEKADKTNLMEVATGGYYPTLGLSNGEIAALSRSMHRSQGFGSQGTRQNQIEYLEFLKGDFPKEKQDVFEGIDTSWKRLKGGEAIGALLNPLEVDFNFTNPSEMIPVLLEAYALITKLEDAHWKAVKTAQIKALIQGCLGLYIETISADAITTPLESSNVVTEVTNRSKHPFILKNLYIESTPQTPLINAPVAIKPLEKQELKLVLPPKKENNFTTPYWLATPGSLGMYNAPSNLIGKPETPAAYMLLYEIEILGHTLTFSKPVVYKYTDPAQGEMYQPLEVLPEVTTSITEKVWVFPNKKPQTVPVQVRINKDSISGSVRLQVPSGWKVSPPEYTFEMLPQYSVQSFSFEVTPPDTTAEGELKPLVQVGDVFYDKSQHLLDYAHIPKQHVLLPSAVKAVRINLDTKGHLIGYINGAGDAIPESLQQIGYDVEFINPSAIDATPLTKFDAIVVGIRAYNVVKELNFHQEQLLDYVNQGGTLIVQYNTNRRLTTSKLGPYPLRLSRDRVTDEKSKVQFLEPAHKVLNFPNKITAADFEGWVQERGLYFPDQWDANYTAILGMNDADETLKKGSLLVAAYGKGHYVYTGLSFFRELPAGVAGAYRLFANLVSLGKD